MTRSGHLQAFEYKVSVSPFAVDGEKYSILSFADTSHERRKKVLERIFFHDILNTAGNMVGLSDLMSSRLPEVDREDVDLIRLSYKQLVEEIKSQRILVRAENKELIVRRKTIDTIDCLKQIAELYKEFSTTQQIAIQIGSHSEQVPMESDRTLLVRVLSNMVKNALEASAAGETVTMGCEQLDRQIQFWVHTPTYIPRDIQLQIFKRSFSTKGDDRGLGTYSIKLLVENYLNGYVACDTSRTAGTHFYATIPLSLSANPKEKRRVNV